jgi:hypothetical protein
MGHHGARPEPPGFVGHLNRSTESVYLFTVGDEAIELAEFH